MSDTCRATLVATLGAALVLGAAVTGACTDGPTSPTTTPDEAITTPVVVTYPGVVGPGGSASRSFTAQLAGRATAVLDAAADTRLILGMGVPRADGAGCLLGRSTVAAAGHADISAAVDVGTFCVQVQAPPDHSGTASYTVTLEHP